MISPMSDEMLKGQCCTGLVNMVTALKENAIYIYIGILVISKNKEAMKCSRKWEIF